MRFFDAISRLGWAGNSDDIFLRLNYMYTTIGLLLMSFFMLLMQYIWTPITCWIPAQFTGAHAAYTEKVCWYNPDYYSPNYNPQMTTTTTPNPILALLNISGPVYDDGRRVSYHHGVPGWLFFQALFFFVPVLFWKAALGKTGIDLKKLYMGGDSSAVTNKVVQQFDSYFQDLKKQRQLRRTTGLLYFVDYICLGCGKMYGCFLIVVFFAVKVYYIANVINQYGMIYNFFGGDFIRKIASNFLLWKNDWPVSDALPYHTMCDFQIRNLGFNLQRYTVQCTVSYNYLAVTVYVWFCLWLGVLMIVNVLSLLSWLLTMFTSHCTVRYQLLHDKLVASGEDPALAKEFVDSYLMHDGAFLLGMIDKNTNKGVATEVLSSLFNKYRESASTPMRESV